MADYDDMNSKALEVYRKYFHFFDIPHFLDEHFIKAVMKLINDYFDSEDANTANKSTKDSKISNLNGDSVTSALNNLSSQISAQTTSLQTVIDNINKQISANDTAISNAEKAFKEIKSAQESYDWFTGTIYSPT